VSAPAPPSPPELRGLAPQAEASIATHAGANRKLISLCERILNF
jgi:hypothetical protein